VLKSDNFQLINVVKLKF